MAFKSPISKLILKLFSAYTDKNMQLSRSIFTLTHISLPDTFNSTKHLSNHPLSNSDTPSLVRPPSLHARRPANDLTKHPNQPHLLNKYHINMGFSHFREFGISSGMHILAPYQIDIVKGCGFCNGSIIVILY